MEELKKLAQMYEDRVLDIKNLLDGTKDYVERIVLQSEIVIYQTIITDIYRRILEIQKQN